MKNLIITLLLNLFFITGFSQNSKFEYKGRSNPFAKKEKLNSVNYVTDITPELWSKMGLPNEKREELEELRKRNYPLGYYLYPPGGYDRFINYVSVEISAFCNGKFFSSESTSSILTPEQKNILSNSDIGSDVDIKIMFKFKNNGSNENDILQGGLTVTVVPETEAEYPGGFQKLTEYLRANVFNAITDQRSLDKISNAVVKFTVNESGQIVEAKIMRTSSDAKKDVLLLDAIHRMPKWKPAKNSKGINVKQMFSIPMGMGGC